MSPDSEGDFQAGTPAFATVPCGRGLLRPERLCCWPWVRSGVRRGAHHPGRITARGWGMRGTRLRPGPPPRTRTASPVYTPPTRRDAVTQGEPTWTGQVVTARSPQAWGAAPREGALGGVCSVGLGKRAVTCPSSQCRTECCHRPVNCVPPGHPPPFHTCEPLTSALPPPEGRVAGTAFSDRLLPLRDARVRSLHVSSRRDGSRAPPSGATAVH